MARKQGEPIPQKPTKDSFVISQTRNTDFTGVRRAPQSSFCWVLTKLFSLGSLPYPRVCKIRALLFYALYKLLVRNSTWSLKDLN